MSRLTIPEADITLYEDGFEGHDQLGRKSTADALSDLVDRIEDPMVIALDGGWGSGKSFFLKCWVGEHLQRKGNTTQTVYFDAFANDFMDEPLVSLLACLLERFEELGPEEKSKLDKAKAVAWKLGPSALRIGASWLTFGATNHLGDAGDVVAEAVGDEFMQSADSFWREAQERQGVMEQFREALKALTVGEDGEARKLVIVVDELDRCRPDYALALLEIIKHFFAVPHVHFVLGVNLGELENSVKARYGADITAELYLQKFVTLTMRLPETTNAYENKSVAISYFEMNSAKASVDAMQHGYVLGILKSVRDKESVTLRAVQRLITLLQISTIPDMCLQDEILEKTATSSLSVLRVLHPPMYKDINTGRIGLEDLQSVFDMKAESTKGASKLLFDCWQLFLTPKDYTERMGYSLATSPTVEDQLKRLQEIKLQHLECV